MNHDRLSEAHLGALPSSIATPAYARSIHQTGVVHLGTGAFHRAHQAVYFDRLMAMGERDWMIEGASLRSPTVAEQLNPQGGLYTVTVREGTRETTSIIGSIRKVHVAPENPFALIAAMTQPSVSLVTLTVTEKGYKPSAASGGMSDPDPDVRHDLAHPDNPRTALGVIAAALYWRMRAGDTGLTILSCDNLPSNGQRTREGVMAYATARDFAFADWVSENCSFPSSMVDRIVPSTTDEDISALAARTGFTDLGMVKTEPFSQWVIEDNFATRRPPLDTVGVQFTNDVHAWETAKLRLLNGAHSALAYLGALAGHTYVHEAMAAPGFTAFIDRLWNEAQSTLRHIDGFFPFSYRHQLTERFCNAALQHRTVQIAMDGSQKLPQRLLASLRERRGAGADSPALVTAVAAWMRWQFGRDEMGNPYKVDDPMAERTARLLAEQGKDPVSSVRALMSIREIFGDLSQDETLVAQLAKKLEEIVIDGAAATVAHVSGNG